jgi:transcriptional regulator with XRE-family HTH domain
MLHDKAQQKIPIWLRTHRKKQKLSQIEAAQKLGHKSAALLSRWEKGVATPNLINICKLILLYNVSFEELFYDVLEEVREKFPELTENRQITSNNTIYE